MNFHDSQRTFSNILSPVRVLEKRQGFIDAAGLERVIVKLRKPDYGRYLRGILG